MYHNMYFPITKWFQGYMVEVIVYLFVIDGRYILEIRCDKSDPV